MTHWASGLMPATTENSGSSSDFACYEALKQPVPYASARDLPWPLRAPPRLGTAKG